MATKYNLIMDQGSDFTTSFNLKNLGGIVLNLSTFTGRSQMRQHYTSLTSVDLDVSVNANGMLYLTLPSNETANIEPGRYLYDIELTDSGNNTFRIIEGIITVTPNITR
jgi:hypothetical protein